MTTKLDLAAALALADEAEARWGKATPGRWMSLPETNRHALWKVSTTKLDEGSIAIGCYEKDASAIASARTTEPALAALVRQLVGEVKRQRDRVGFRDETNARLVNERDAALAQVHQHKRLLREARAVLDEVAAQIWNRQPFTTSRLAELADEVTVGIDSILSPVAEGGSGEGKL